MNTVRRPESFTTAARGSAGRLCRLAQLACLSVLWLGAASVASAQAANESERLVAEARASAFASLRTHFGQLQLTPDRRVEDFLADHPVVEAFAWNAICQSARASAPQRYSDGAVAVQVSVPISQVVLQLKKSWQTHATNDATKPEAFDKIHMYTFRRAVWGFGASRGEARSPLADDAPVGWYDVGAFERLKARHRATENACSLLLRRIRSLQISPSRNVADFDRADDRVARSLEVFVRSRPTIEEVGYLPEGVCRVRLSVSVADLIGELKFLAMAHAAEHRFSPAEFDSLALYAGDSDLRVTGVAVPGKEKKEVLPRPRENGAAAEENLLTAKAESSPPGTVEDPDQARLLATRAAMGVCREKLRERMLEREAPRGTTGRELVGQYPQFRRDVDRLLDNLRLVGVRDREAGRVSVTTELPTSRLDCLLRYYEQKEGETESVAEE